jgi:hypothetical protein
MARKLSTTRLRFTREAPQGVLARAKEREKERKHREGYLRKSPARGEFQLWEEEQVWGVR